MFFEFTPVLIHTRLTLHQQQHCQPEWSKALLVSVAVHTSLPSEILFPKLLCEYEKILQLRYKVAHFRVSAGAWIIACPAQKFYTKILSLQKVFEAILQGSWISHSNSAGSKTWSKLVKKESTTLLNNIQLIPIENFFPNKTQSAKPGKPF